MQSPLGFLGIISALTATGICLTCKECGSADYATCYGDIITCPSDNVCGTTYTLLDKLFGGYFTTCIPKNRCNTMGSISYTTYKIKKSTTCCYTDNCSPPKPTLPADNNQKNGISCITCTKSGLAPSWCHSLDTLECTGNENSCVKMVNALEVVRGCSSESICSIGTETTSGGTLDYACNITSKPPTNGSVKLRSDLFFTLIFSIAVAKNVCF